MSRQTYWSATQSLPEFSPLTAQQTIDVDVAVVGGGISGITATYLLHEAGLSTALFERDRLAGGDTSHTTAHLTAIIDTRPSDVLKRLGEDGARLVFEGGATAIDRIEAIARKIAFECEFRRVPGYLHAPFGKSSKGDQERLRADAEALARLGVDALFLDSIPLMNVPGIQVANQAKFHPLKYLAGMLDLLKADGVPIFEHSEVTEFEEGPRLRVNDCEVKCRMTLIATHVPVQGNLATLPATLFQTKIAPYTSHVVGALAPKGRVPEALFWDTSDPYFYLRVDAKPDGDYLIYGGVDHKTGQIHDPERPFLELAESLERIVPGVQIRDRWSGQVIETHDGLPYIGEIMPKQFIMTGFCGNGITFGTLGALMARDAITDTANPWVKLFDPHRKKIESGWTYVKENIDYPLYFLRDRFGHFDDDIEKLKPREGKIMKVKGRKMAVSRNAQGELKKCSAVCTHMGCIVHWNSAEQTWDCPCHGSRFSPDGAVLAGPAESPLESL